MSVKVLKNTIDHSIIPDNHMELNREINIKDGASIDGAVYGSKIKIQANDATIEKSVYSNLDIYITLEKGNRIQLNSSVIANRSIEMLSNGVEYNVRFGGILKAKKCNLKNSIVYGSILAEDCNISNSIVFGTILTENELILDNCLVNNFSAKNAHLKRNIRLFEPYGLAENKMRIDNPIECILFKKNDAIKEEFLTEDDITTINIHDQNDNVVTQKLLSISGRLLNVKNIRESQTKIYAKYNDYFDLLKEKDFDKLLVLEKELFANHIKHDSN